MTSGLEGGRAKPAEATETLARIRELEDERDRIVAALSGAPGTSMQAVAVDRAALRVRLSELNSELKALSPWSDSTTSELADLPDARTDGRDS